MLSYAYEITLEGDGTVELALPDFPGFCILSYSESSALTHARRLLMSLLVQWLQAGLTIPKGSTGPRVIHVPEHLARRVALHREAVDFADLIFGRRVEESGEVIDFLEARRRLRGDACDPAVCAAR